MIERDNEFTILAQFAREIAQEAGLITLRYFRSGFTTERKRDGSFVTTADKETERYLREAIGRRFPDDAIAGEEEGERAGRTGRRWIIDPVDGTFSFVKGVPFFGVMIGVEIADEPVVGVVNLPALGELAHAARGLGCFLNGERARVSATNTLGDSLLLATDFGACEQFGFGDAANRLEREVKQRRTWGDCYGHILVATGRAEIMLDPVMNVWDCAALLPIVEEAGGTFTDWKGERTIHGGNAISTNGVLFEDVMKAVRGE